MARRNQNFEVYRGDNFTLVANILDAESLTGYKAQWIVFTRSIDGNVHTITRHLTLTTSGHFNSSGVPGQFVNGGITFHDNTVHIEVTSAMYGNLGSSNTEVEFDHQLKLYDGDDVDAVSASGKIKVLKPSPTANLL